MEVDGEGEVMDAGRFQAGVYLIGWNQLLEPFAALFEAYRIVVERVLEILLPNFERGFEVLFGDIDSEKRDLIVFNFHFCGLSLSLETLGLEGSGHFPYEHSLNGTKMWFSLLGA